jgi:LysM repeat protein
MDIKQNTENKPEKQQPQEEPQEYVSLKGATKPPALETQEQNPQEYVSLKGATKPLALETEEQQPQEEQQPEETQKLNTLYKIYLFKNGNKTEKYYFYCNKATPAFNLYKAKKNKKLSKYCKQNDYTIENICALAHLTNETKKIYLKEVLKDKTNCINNLFNRKQNKKDNNKDLPTVRNKEQLKEFLTH